MDNDPGSMALVEALTAELQYRVPAEAPTVVYAWTRRVVEGDGTQLVMFAKVHSNHRSVILEAKGTDGDDAYHRLVDRLVEWSNAQGAAGAEPGPD